MALRPDLQQARSLGTRGITPPFMNFSQTQANACGLLDRAAAAPRPVAPYVPPPLITGTNAYSPFKAKTVCSHGYTDYSASSPGKSLIDAFKGLGAFVFIVCLAGAIFGPQTNKNSSLTEATQPRYSTEFSRGASDRRAWENWFSSLSDDYQLGAGFWASVRNTPGQGSCLGMQGQKSNAFQWGCVEAKRFFDSRQVDWRRKASKDYYRGWNSI